MTDIFISYSRDDKPWVDTLAERLESEGYDVWWDPDILPGQNFEKIIRKELDETKCVITVWSPNSIQLAWVRSESTTALNNNKLIPIMYQSVELPMPFDHIHTEDFSHWKGNTRQANYQKLLRAIGAFTNKELPPLPPEPEKKSNKALVSVLGLLIAVGAAYGGYAVWDDAQQKEREAQFSKVGSLLAQEGVKAIQNSQLTNMQTDQAKQEEEARLAEVEKAKQLAEEKRKAEEAKAKKLAEEKQKAEAARIAKEEALEAERKAKEEAARKKAATEAEQRKKEEAKKAKTIAGRYIDNQDGTITDTQTNLMWKKCSEGLSGNNCSQGKAKKYTWNEAVKQFENVSFANKNNWRLPRIEELRTLVYCSNGTSAKEAWDGGCSKENKKGDYQRPAINQTAFPNTVSGWLSSYWSSSPYAGGSNYAWVLGFYLGYDSSGFKGRGGYVRLVRSGQ